jgi:hypothetical protein
MEERAMLNPGRSRVGAALAVATLLALGGFGCGTREGSESGGAASSGGAVMGKADAVDVTYYYLPG